MTANVNFTLCGRSLVFTSVPFLLSRPNDSDIYNFVITHLLDTKLLYAAVVGCDGNHGFIIARVFISTLLSLSFPFWIMNTDYILPGVIEDNIRPSTPSSLISVWCIWAPRVVNGRPQTKKKKWNVTLFAKSFQTTWWERLQPFTVLELNSLILKKPVHPNKTKKTHNLFFLREITMFYLKATWPALEATPFKPRKL